MLGKYEILIVIFILLITFYLVISFGAKKGGGHPEKQEISRYLFGVRVLIIIIGLVALILWFFI